MIFLKTSSIASFCYIQHSISDENYRDRAIRKQARGHNVCLYDALLMYMRIGKIRYKSHNAVEKEIIELHIDTHTMKLIMDKASGLCCFNYCLFIFDHKQ